MALGTALANTRSPAGWPYCALPSDTRNDGPTVFPGRVLAVHDVAHDCARPRPATVRVRSTPAVIFLKSCWFIGFGGSSVNHLDWQAVAPPLPSERFRK